MPRVGAALTVERVTASFASIAGIHFSKVLKRIQVGGVDRRRMPIEHVGRTEQAVEFGATRSDVVPRDEGGFRRVIEHRLNVLSLQIGEFTFAVVGVNWTHWSQCKKHDCGKNDGAQTTVLSSLWATHHLVCRLRPL